MGLQRVGHNWATELNWTDENSCETSILFCQVQVDIRETFVQFVIILITKKLTQQRQNMEQIQSLQNILLIFCFMHLQLIKIQKCILN